MEDHTAAIVGLLGLFGLMAFGAYMTWRRIRGHLSGATATRQPVSGAPFVFDQDENVRSDLELLSTCTIDRWLVVRVAHLLVCNRRYRKDVPEAYDKACAQVVAVATEWVEELAQRSRCGDKKAFDELHDLYHTVLPDNPELYMPNGQPRITAYQAFKACGMDDILGQESARFTE